jgi:hypothetical protein
MSSTGFSCTHSQLSAENIMDDDDFARRSPGTSLHQVEDISTAKRQKRAYQRHHALSHKPQHIASEEPDLLDSEAVEKLLVEAIKAVLEEQALRLDIEDPAIESLALEALRNAVEECK